MNLTAAFANSAWIAASAPAYARFRHALVEPAKAQWQLLRANLAHHAGTAYGRAHGFAAIRNYADFVQRVPIVDYDDLAPWLARIQRGEPAVLTRDRVTRLLPTSGSSGARKLIPFTDRLQQEFNAAIGPWICDLARQHPSTIGGRAYWSITPVASADEAGSSRVPIGFEEDSRYLGDARARLVDVTMAVPSTVRHIGDLAAFRRAVLRRLLACADLRLISVWHPSFLALLLDTLEREWETLLGSVSARRRRELAHANPAQPETIWPALRVVSCWTDAHAAAPAAELQRRFRQATLQPKGLLATEAFISVPFAGTHPLAICSHFLEFIDAAGNVLPLEALTRGYSYEVVVTTGGGLWRYRLGDRMEVTGFVGRTPSIRFLGRAGNVCDLCGEKLAEAFVAKTLATLCPAARFALLAPEHDETGAHYTLFLEAENIPAVALAESLETALRANPHYALCRDLGQLERVRIFPIARGGYEKFTAAEIARGRRLGDIKPTALSPRTDWAQHFIESRRPAHAL